VVILCGISAFAFLCGLRWLEWHKQRREVISRIESYGGWEKLRQACESFASNRLENYAWQSPGTGTTVWIDRQTQKPYATNSFHELIPAQFSALNPQTVYYHAPEPSESEPEGNIKEFCKMPVFQIGFFGTHRAFGEDASNSFYGIEIACGTNADIYFPRPPQFSLRNRWFPGDWHSHYRKVAKGVFEIY